MEYENFNLSDWPFRTTADEDFASIWAGRKKTKLQLDRLLQKMTLVPKSGLHLFWANFGMGKTHTLFHLKYRSMQTKGQIIPIYAVMPKRSTGFLELYREIIQAFLSAEMRDYLGKQLVNLGQASKAASIALHPMFSRSPGVVRALLAMRNADIEATTAAMQWLAAQPGLDSRAIKNLGLTYRIRSPEDAIAALCALINLAVWGPTPKQLLLMIDEYQRIGELNPKIINQVNSSLHTIFNSHPTGLQLLLTFSFGNKENVEYLVSPELESRAEPQTINLDILSYEEATEFLADLLSSHRLSNEDQRVLFPFSKETVNTMLLTIGKRKSITPRRIMLFANHILLEHMLNISDSTVEITNDEVVFLLNDPQLGEIDVDSEPS